MKQGYYWGRPTVLSKPQPIAVEDGLYFVIGVGDPMSSIYELGEFISDLNGDK